MTRAAVLAELARRELEADGDPAASDLRAAIDRHLEAACDAATRPPRHRWLRSGDAGVLRAVGNLDAAEALLLQSARRQYVVGQLPALLDGVRRRLPDHPISADVERLAATRDVGDPGDRERLAVASRLLSRARLTELARLRSFHDVVLVTAMTVSVLAVGLAVLGRLQPEALPLCVRGADRTVCPGDFNGRYDLLLVELTGLVGAALTAAAGLRGLRGTSTPYAVPVAVALLSLPVGALLAVVGMLLLSGRLFTALLPLPDTRAQLLAWAAVFGAAQALVLRPVQARAQQVMVAAEDSRRPVGSEPLTGRALLVPAVVVVALAAVAGGGSLWRATVTSGTAAKAYGVAAVAALIATAGLIAAAQQRREAKRRAQALAVRLERLGRQSPSGAPAERETLLREARELRDRLTDAGDLEEAAALDLAISGTSPEAGP
ncbi:hypothetical protein [Actinoplanes sp. URMC 104]|uniref:hypothetical protein n=1 Tax=Actinoplanes sp. URMC 104 TaxID=3423409 RepID=UPI003F1CA5AC